MGSKDLEYCCVVKDGFQKTNLYQKGIGKDEEIIITITVFLGPRGGRVEK